jgi:predicted nucleic acid-binding protein
MRRVLDASALVAYLGEERGCAVVSDALTRAAEHEEPLLISAVNWGEAHYVVTGKRGAEMANQIMEALASFPIDVVPVDKTFAEQAAEFKADKKLSYADGFAAALAQSSGGELLTCDKDFESVAKTIKIVWVR